MAKLRNKAYPPHRADIRAAIERKWGSYKTAALALGVTAQNLSNAVLDAKTARVEIALAEAMELDPRRIWPDRWENPTPKRELWLLKNTEKLAAWASRELNDVGRDA
jgi:lambda repressor-like predicted transcriptional regulator